MRSLDLGEVFVNGRFAWRLNRDATYSEISSVSFKPSGMGLLPLLSTVACRIILLLLTFGQPLVGEVRAMTR
jgi:hypothetical protein